MELSERAAGLYLNYILVVKASFLAHRHTEVATQLSIMLHKVDELRVRVHCDLLEHFGRLEGHGLGVAACLDVGAERLTAGVLRLIVRLGGAAGAS